MKNKNTFLITCVSCIMLLLFMCYFGVNSSLTKGTSAAIMSNEEICASQGLTYMDFFGVCCPTGYTSDVISSSDIKYCANGNLDTLDDGGMYCTIYYTTVDECKDALANGQINEGCQGDLNEDGVAYWVGMTSDLSKCTVASTDPDSIAVEPVYITFVDEDTGLNVTNHCTPTIHGGSCDIEFPTNPEKSDGEGFFLGWTTVKGACGMGYYYNSGSYPVNVSATWYSCWSDRYNIAYDLNGGTKGTESAVAGYTNSESTITINNPTKTVTVTGNANGTGATIGNATSAVQTFKGWTFDGNTSTAYYNDGTTFYGWTSHTYLVKDIYFKNLGNDGSTVTMTANWTPVAVKLPTVTKSGYTCGWSLTSGGTTIAYDSGESYTPAADSAASLTVYAVCKTNSTSGGDTGDDDDSGETTTKADPGLSLNVTSYRVDIKVPESKTISYTYNGNGKVTCSSSNTSIATCEVKDGKLVIKSVSEGSTVVTLKASETSTYKGDSESVSVYVSEDTTTTPDDGNDDDNTGNTGNTDNDNNNNDDNKNEDKDGNVTDYPETGEIAIAVVWFLGLFAIGYSFWYFKRAKEEN